MKIAIDISMGIGETAGVGDYTRGLIQGLARVDAANEYLLYAYLDGPETCRFDLPQAPNFSFQSFQVDGGHRERLWSAAELPPPPALDAVDIVHSSVCKAPQRPQGGLVVTIPSLSFLTHPELHIETQRLHCFNGVLKAAQYADRLITISQQTKQDLMNYFAVREERIRIVHEAPGAFCYPERNHDVLRSALDRLGIYHNFMFCMGSLGARDNLQSLIEAYVTYVRNDSGRELLVIAGAQGWLKEDITQRVEALGVQDCVKFLGDVPEDDLRVLYSAAKLCVYPSPHVGFGLSPLDAMACGAPIIASNAPTLSKVVEDAAIVLDPSNSAELCDAMRRVLNDQRLRLETRQRGLERAALFTWERAARETLAVYEEACPER